VEQHPDICESGQNIGLGLKISYLIVKEYDGIIDYTSDHKKGSTFYFTFTLMDANNHYSN
jgi:K+-sensing histidine kinase KdpD